LRTQSAGPAQTSQLSEGQPAPAARRPTRYPQYVPPEPLPYVPPLPQTTYDSGVARQVPPAYSLDPASQQDRVKAFRFANPAVTVAKGTIIQAVLETALDSTRPGFARAIVARDVFGFDGTRILIPRGSRLIGEYKSDLAPGQNRALIQWQRLMRLDGVVINLDSPATDPLGRAGVRGKVDSHLLERFAGALLQTAANIGSQVALNKATDTTIVYAVPVGQGTQVASAERVQRTLKVKQGASVSVFVAKDLDFSTVEP
jgi:type IV secretion system protein VirB10